MYEASSDARNRIGIRHLVHLAGAAQRHALQHLRPHRRIGGRAGRAHRRHQPRMHRIGADAVAAELHRGGFRQCAHRALRRVVAHMRHGLAGVAGDRRQIDDRSAAGLLHRQHGVFGAQEHAARIHRHQLVPRVGVQHVGHRAAADAGIVHQDVELAVFLHGRIDHRLPVGLVGHVQAHEFGRAVGARDLGGDLAAVVLQHVGNHHLGAFLGKSARRRGAHAGGRTADDRHFAFQAHDPFLPGTGLWFRLPRVARLATGAGGC